MSKDKRIGELPGISASAAVGLNRIGIITMHDLLTAEFDRVAYVVDDYNEAARLLREAKKVADAGSGRRRSAHTEPTVPAPLSHSPPPSNNRAHLRARAQPASQPHSHSHAASHAPSHTQPHAQTPPPQQPKPAPTTGGALAQAMAALGHGLSLTGETAQRDRAMLARRLSVAAMLVEQVGSEPELIVSAILESVESGALAIEEVGPRFGKNVESLLEECTALRAVPMLPTGKPPRYYLDMAKNASRESRRVCAAHLLASLGDGPEATPGGPWYAKLLLEGLEAAGPDDLVAEVRRAMVGPQRRAA